MYNVSTFPFVDMDGQKSKTLVLSDDDGNVVCRLSFGHVQAAALRAALTGSGRDIIMTANGHLANRVTKKLPENPTIDLCRCKEPLMESATPAESILANLTLNTGEKRCRRCFMVAA